VSVTAPPRPPRPSDPVDREEIEALVEALIEEARKRAQCRRRRNAAVVTLVALVGAALFAVLGRSAQSQTASPALSARSTAPAQAGTSRIAFFTSVLKPSRSGGFVQTELYVMNADGSGMRRLVRHESGLEPEPYGGGAFGAVWSPDGLKLAFGKRLGPAIGQCGVCHTEIFVVSADGTGQRNLTRKGFANPFRGSSNQCLRRMRGWNARALTPSGTRPRWSSLTSPTRALPLGGCDSYGSSY
jgi:Tol biopolymer transport system component